MHKKNKIDIDRPIAIILLSGVLVSVVLLLGGIGMSALNPDLVEKSVGSVGHELHETIKLNPSGWMNLGIFVLILTPVMRVIAAAFSFAWIKDWKYFWVASTIFVAMMVGFFYGDG